jgi:glycosyltransferase involved in cell wall biosynthesis
MMPGPGLPVSLIVPVLNEAGSLAALVAAIRRQTHPPAELIIVDGGSTDGTLDLARKLSAGEPHFRLLAEARGTPGHNRNVGAEAAACDWLAFTDAGAGPEPDWLEQLVAQAARDAEAEVVYGNYEPFQATFFERAAALAYVAPNEERDGGRMRGPSVSSTLLRRHVWRETGGFPDLRAAEDLFFMERVAAGGFTIAWAPRATIRWRLQPGLASTFRRFALYSKHNARAGRLHDWHYGVARHYALVTLLILLGVVHTPWWLLGLPLWLAARVFRNIWRRREQRGLLWTLNPARFAAVAVILLTIDLATFTGWIAATASRISGAGRRTG